MKNWAHKGGSVPKHLKSWICQLFSLTERCHLRTQEPIAQQNLHKSATTGHRAKLSFLGGFLGKDLSSVIHQLCDVGQDMLLSRP